MLDVAAPRSKAEILNALIASDRAAEAIWDRFSAPDLFTPLGGGWSPAENIRHLSKSIRPVARALKLPRFLLRLLFGTASGPSRGYEQVKAAYLGVLGGGAGAGRFAPSPEAPPQDPATRRAEILRERAVASAQLAVAIADWSDNDLDRLRLPHPLLGKISVREMLFFTLYHNQHHANGVARKLESGQ